MPFNSRSAVAFALVAVGASSRADPKNPTYDEDIRPVLAQHCLGCHSADKQKGGLDLSTYSAVQAGGSSGDVLIPGDPDKSRLYALTAHAEEPKMPPKADRIPAAQLAVLKQWVEQGGRENAGSKVTVARKPELTLNAKMVGKPDGPPPMPQPGKLPTQPVVVGRRPNPVIALAASPWAPVFAVGGHRQIILGHAETGADLGVLPFEAGQVNVARFSRNGRLLLAAGGRGGSAGRAVLYNVETGETLTEVGAAETDAILSADLSADQSLVAVGGPSRAVRVYRTSDGSVAYTLRKHTDWVTAAEFSPDGVLLATGDRNGGLIVWEAATGREFHTLRGHTDAITEVSWRPDSNTLASASEDGTVRLWEVENGNAVKNWKPHGGAGVASVRFGPDGRLATTGRDHQAKLWDGNGDLVKQAEEPLSDLGLRVAVAADAQRILVGDWSGSVRLWAAADGRTVDRFDPNPRPLEERRREAEAAVAAAEGLLLRAEEALAAARASIEPAQAELLDAAELVEQTKQALTKAYVAQANAPEETEPAAAEAVQAADAAYRIARQRVKERNQAIDAAHQNVTRCEAEVEAAEQRLTRAQEKAAKFREADGTAKQ